ncbi:hypothetical protein [Rhodospirillaceae bacterium SYSU D60014]|uniref:hypothetical protein n=1 Tax=Virgifigura deserti TaxID=2268457 RepID=UPI000E6678F3
MTAINRRRFLAGSALAGAGFLTAAGAPVAARAFSFESANQETHKAYLNACSINSVHDELIEEVVSKLGDRLSPEEVEATLASLSCPYCGCPLG